MRTDKTINLFRKHYQMLLDKYDGRSVPMQLIKSMIDSVSIQIGDTCLHEHLACPGDIRTLKCAYCGKGLYKVLKK